MLLVHNFEEFVTVPSSCCKIGSCCFLVTCVCVCVRTHVHDCVPVCLCYFSYKFFINICAFFRPLKNLNSMMKLGKIPFSLTTQSSKINSVLFTHEFITFLLDHITQSLLVMCCQSLNDRSK